MSLVHGVLARTVPGARFGEPISCHHNHVAEETHDGVDVLVPPQGHDPRRRGDLGIIPGSMGTGP
ncbi:RtcB family protein [Saccharopolyspora thermophila]|nr:RtcB family protein [Saccharopolyspora subtropica]